MRVHASLFLTCCGGLAQSVFQVRSTVSGLVHFGAALSGSQPGVQGVCGAQERKRTRWNTPALHCEMLPDAEKNRYPGTMTKLQVPLRSSGTWMHRPLWESEKSLWGSSLHSCMSFSFKKTLPWCFRSKCRSCPWQARFKRMLMHPRPFK